MADSGRIEKKKDRQTNQADMGQKRRHTYEYHGTSDFSVFIYWLLSFAVREQRAKCTEVLRADAGSNEGTDYGK